MIGGWTGELGRLQADFWSQFHKLWGQNKDGEYDKREWAKLQNELQNLEQELITITNPNISFLLLQEKLKKIRETFLVNK